MRDVYDESMSQLVQARVPAAMQRKLAKLARRHERTIAAELRVAIDEHLAAHDSHAAKPQRGR